MTILKLKIPYVRSSLPASNFPNFWEFWELSSLATLKFPSEGQLYLFINKAMALALDTSIAQLFFNNVGSYNSYSIYGNILFN